MRVRKRKKKKDRYVLVSYVYQNGQTFSLSSMTHRIRGEINKNEIIEFLERQGKETPVLLGAFEVKRRLFQTGGKQ